MTLLLIMLDVRVQAPSTPKEILKVKWEIDLTLSINLSVQALCLKIRAKASTGKLHQIF